MGGENKMLKLIAKIDKDNLSKMRNYTKHCIINL